ncbi:MAG TPA: hypothetical protein VLX68_07540 [Chitinivibrionales bacterium]|nr:hypothetical protein [Chitinivibrionales bacterium]
MKKLAAVLLVVMANCVFGQCSSERCPKSSVFLEVEAKVAAVVFPESVWTKTDGALKGGTEAADKNPLCAYVKNSIVTTPRGTYKCLIAYFDNVNTYKKKCLVCELQYEFNVPLTKSRPVMRVVYWADAKGTKFKKSITNFSRKWFDIGAGTSQDILAKFIASHK